MRKKNLNYFCVFIGAMKLVIIINYFSGMFINIIYAVFFQMPTKDCNFLQICCVTQNEMSCKIPVSQKKEHISRTKIKGRLLHKISFKTFASYLLYAHH